MTYMQVAKRHLHPWVRAGNVKLRLQMLRRMEVPAPDRRLSDDEPFDDPKKLFQEFAAMVIQTLVDVGKGESRQAAKKDYVLYPFGSAGANTYSFKTAIPDSYFATVLSELYPFVVTETTNEEKWQQLLKACHHPMTKLWPLPLMKRYMSYMTKFGRQRKELFQCYDDCGGEYFDDNEEPDEAPKRKRPRKCEPPPSSEDEFDDFDLE